MATFKLRPKNLGYYKPKGYEKHLTLTELGRHVNRDTSWIRQLEASGRIPQAVRVRHGKLKIRLWSPAQVKEIEEIFNRMKVGRPAKQ